MNNQQFPADLLRRHKAVNEKLKKFKRVLFKRFGPNVSEISDEFNQLAIEFKNASLLEYAGLSWQNAAECEHIIENSYAEIDYLLKAARSYHDADIKLEKLCIRSNDRAFIECALQCYNNAITLLPDGSPMKAAVVREMLKVKPSVEVSSGFTSPSHKIHELEVAAKICVQRKDFTSALDKRTEVMDSINERNVQYLYVDVIRRNELSRLLLLLLLELPSTRLVESHTILLDRFTKMPSDHQYAEQIGLSNDLFLCLSELVLACRKKKMPAAADTLDRLFLYKESRHRTLFIAGGIE
ncbi:hypothetical protein HA402_013739 [Bradysia odoriphaga]|nr:hypothetical protein HA402_013739 [Bradysia odoriphaga]